MERATSRLPVRPETHERLKKFRITRFDTFDEILNRLMDEHEAKKKK